MKVVFLTDKNVVTKVFLDIYDPIIKENKIVHDNGKIIGIEEVDKFVIVENHIPVQVGQIATNDFLEYDKSHIYEEKDLGDKLAEVGEEIKEEIKDVFDSDDKKER